MSNESEIPIHNELRKLDSTLHVINDEERREPPLAHGQQFGGNHGFMQFHDGYFNVSEDRVRVRVHLSNRFSSPRTSRGRPGRR